MNPPSSRRGKCLCCFYHSFICVGTPNGRVMVNVRKKFARFPSNLSESTTASFLPPLRVSRRGNAATQSRRVGALARYTPRDARQRKGPREPPQTKKNKNVRLLLPSQPLPPPGAPRALYSPTLRPRCPLLLPLPGPPSFFFVSLLMTVSAL